MSLGKRNYKSEQLQPKRLKTEENEDFDEIVDFDSGDGNLEDASEITDNKVVIDHDGEEFAKWSRPSLGNFSENEKLIFQQIDIDNYDFKGSTDFPASPVFRLYGINMSGNSIMAHVHNFFPYFYVDAPTNFNERDGDIFKLSLNEALKKNVKGNANPVIAVDRCMKSSIFGFNNGSTSSFLKVTVATNNLIAASKRAFDEGFFVKGYGTITSKLYDNNIDFSIRFMVDSGLVGCSWVEISAGKYTIRKHDKKASLCQLEVDVDWKNIHQHSVEEMSDIAPLRILSFDIECAGRKGVFPEADIDPVIQISNVIIRFGEPEPFIKNIFTLKSCAPIVGAHVISFDTEEELLKKWSSFIREVDPDLITGYNIQNFDFPYLINRAHALNVDTFPFLGRVKMIRSVVKEVQTRSKQMGRRENKLININGRVQLDLLQILFRDHKLRSYSLNAVSFHFLGEQKEDVAYQIITDLQNGDEITRRRLAVYCLKDSYLVIRLLNKLMCVVNNVEMARVTGVPFSYLLTRGQQIKVLSQLMRKAAPENFVLPDYESRQNDEFEGATVIEPVRGFYSKPIATLDFSSLYPSIMMAHNLCYSTLLRGETHIEKLGLSPGDYIKTPTGSYFVKKSVKPGLLPRILQDLIDARKRAKRELAVEIDPFKRQVLDGRQLALKISANSVYGFTGAQIGRLPCLDISSSVTGFGREMIDKTKNLVEQTFTKSNGYEHNAKVIYGDTDSVMCNFGVETVKEAMILGKKAAEHISEQFIAPIKLEFEKVYYPYLLINKKRYAGMYYTKPETFDKMDCKGLETVRRDNCPLVANVLNNVLKKLLIDRNEMAALNYTRSIMADLLCNRIDISQLIISKELTKTEGEYAGNQAHTYLANKMRERDPGSAPQLGDRVPYVIIAGTAKSIYTRAEDPLEVLEKTIPIDTDYYLQNQLKGPLLRIFEPIFGSESKAIEKLFKGEHMLTKSQQISKTSKLFGHFYVKETCVGCRTMLRPNEKSICQHCQPKASAIYLKETAHLATLEEKFSRLWTQCQRCAGSVMQEVLCSNRDCPIFYMRKKVQQDLISQDKVVTKLDLDLSW